PTRRSSDLLWATSILRTSIEFSRDMFSCLVLEIFSRLILGGYVCVCVCVCVVAAQLSKGRNQGISQSTFFIKASNLQQRYLNRKWGKPSGLHPVQPAPSPLSLSLV